MPYPNPPSTEKTSRGRFQASFQRLLADTTKSRALIWEIRNQLRDGVIASRRTAVTFLAPVGAETLILVTVPWAASVSSFPNVAPKHERHLPESRQKSGNFSPRYLLD